MNTSATTFSASMAERASPMGRIPAYACVHSALPVTDANRVSTHSWMFYLCCAATHLYGAVTSVAEGYTCTFLMSSMNPKNIQAAQSPQLVSDYSTIDQLLTTSGLSYL